MKKYLELLERVQSNLLNLTISLHKIELLSTREHIKGSPELVEFALPPLAEDAREVLECLLEEVSKLKKETDTLAG
jgi:hypothetical protein